MKVPCSGMDKIASAALIVLAIRGMDNAAVIPPRRRCTFVSEWDII